MQNKKKMFRSQTFENYNDNKYSSIFFTWSVFAIQRQLHLCYVFLRTQG